jgi:hypothetical protein
VDFVLLMHDRLSISMTLYMVIIGLWGLGSYATGGQLGGSLAGSFVIGQLLIVAQVLLGVVLVLAGYRPGDDLHYLYGVSAILVLPFAYSYLRDRHPRQSLLIYSLLALFVAGLAIRGIVTA